jgi:hypothetical protein
MFEHEFMVPQQHKSKHDRTWQLITKRRKEHPHEQLIAAYSPGHVYMLFTAVAAMFMCQAYICSSRR